MGLRDAPLGCTAFGGPAAHIALLRDEAVQRRRWLTEQEFLDLLGVSGQQLSPVLVAALAEVERAETVEMP